MGEKIAAKIVRRAWETSKIPASTWRGRGGGWRGESSRTVGMARTNAENVGGRLRIVGDSQAEHSSNGYNLDDLMSVGRLWVRSPMRRERVTLESRTLSRRGSACNESNAEDSANRV